MPPRVTSQDSQNTNVQFGNESLPNKQTSDYNEIPPKNVPKSQDKTCIKMSNSNTSTPNANKLNLYDCYNQQHIAIPSISQILPPVNYIQPEMKWPTRPTNTITTFDAGHEQEGINMTISCETYQYMMGKHGPSRLVIRNRKMWYYLLIVKSMNWQLLNLQAPHIKC